MTLRERCIEAAWDALPDTSDKSDMGAVVEAVSAEIARYLREEAFGKFQPHVYTSFADGIERWVKA